MAGVVKKSGDVREAIVLYTRSVKGRETVLGLDHPETLKAMSNLAFLHYQQLDTAEAVALYEKVVESQSRMLGENHASTLRSMDKLASVLTDGGRVTEAKQLYQKVLAGYESNPITSTTSIKTVSTSHPYPSITLSITPTGMSRY